MNTKYLQVLTWEQVRNEVQLVNPELVTIIDALDPDNKFKLIKANYKFGDLVIHNGRLFLPDPNQNLLPWDDQRINPEIQARLSYAKIPLFIILNKAMEVFIDTNSRAIPLNLILPGRLAGIFEAIDFMFNNYSNPSWSVAAGARTIFTLPKITEQASIRKLINYYQLPVINNGLHNLTSHWKLFRALAHSPHFGQNWQNEVLFFSENWLKNNYHDANWAIFHQYIFAQGWQQAQHALKKLTISATWEIFAKQTARLRIKASAYLADQIKHLLAIASGQCPGIRPSDNSQLIAPTQGLEHALLEIYQLKYYWPTIMYPTLLNQTSGPVYYSLVLPTILDGTPYKNSTTTLISDLKQFKQIIELGKEELFTNISTNILKKINLSYFSITADPTEQILSSQLITNHDTRFINLTLNQPATTALRFCATSAFWRGSIKITSLDQETVP